MQVSTDLLIPCPNCGSIGNPKAGFQEGLQRFFCGICDLHYTAKTPQILHQHYWFSEEMKSFAVNLYIQGYFPKQIQIEFEARYKRVLSKKCLYSWLLQNGIKPKFRSFTRLNRNSNSVIMICPRCLSEQKMKKRGTSYNGKQRYECPHCGTMFIDGHVCGDPKYPESFKERAVQLYASNASMSLVEVASILNEKYSFSPPLSSDTIGRWVEQRAVTKSKVEQSVNRVFTRKERYGPKGLPREKILKLSDWRKKLWNNPQYRTRMSAAMKKAKIRAKIEAKE